MQVLNLSFAGIHSTTNSLNDQTINGGLLKADNVVIDQPNIAKSRRGFKKYNTQNNEAIRSLATYKSNLVVFTDSKLMSDDGTGTYTTLSSSISSPLSSKKFHYVESNKNFYYCDSNGVFKLDSLSSVPVLAGVPEALTITSFSSISSGTAVEDSKQVAYRIVYGYKDKNNNLILGAPSDRKIFANTSGGTVNVTGLVRVPNEILNPILGSDITYFFQVYRSTATALTVTPDDELQQVYEEAIIIDPTDPDFNLYLADGTQDPSDIANSLYVKFEDIQPEDMMGAFLYTDETQEGITQANYRPPLCTDAELYKNCVFYANTKGFSSFSSNLLGVDTSVNANANVFGKNDTITIGTGADARIFEGVDTLSLTPTNIEFVISNNASPSLAIQETVQNFIDAVNNSDCLCYAFYSSTDTEMPGRFTLKARNLEDDNISITTTKPNAFSPSINNAKTVSEENKNRVYFSKPQQPEAVPILNYIDVGSANYDIKRIVALRDSLFVLKSDGIYRISGESASSFSCKLFDGTTSIIASETAVAFNNMVFCVADQGIITISETGVSIISMPIENDLFELSEFTNFSSLAFGIAYSSDRKYILFVPTKADDTTCTQAFIYNSYTNTFVRWDMSRSCGVVRPSETKQGELFLGTADGITYKERKNFDISDYCDDEYPVRIISIQPYKVTLSSLPSEVQVGFTIKQGVLSSIIEKIVERIVIPEDPNDPPYTVFDLTLSNNSVYDPYNAKVEHNGVDYSITITNSVAYSVTLYSIPSDIAVGDTLKQGSLSSTITAIDTVHKTLTLSNDKIYDIPDNATIYTPIKKVIEWFPITCNNPSFFKHFREITFMFLEAQFKNLSFSVYSDSSPDSEETQILATSLGAWGYGGWGLLPWGGEVGGRQAIRSYIPLEKSRCRWLDLTLTSNQALTQFEVSGISLMYSLASERDQR